MKRREAVRVSTVDYFVKLVVLIEVLLGKAEDLYHLVSVSCINLGPVVHFDFSDVLFALLHGRRLLGSLARGTLHGRCAGSGLLRSARATTSCAAVGGELVRLLVVVVTTVHVVLIVTSWRATLRLGGQLLLLRLIIGSRGGSSSRARSLRAKRRRLKLSATLIVLLIILRVDGRDARACLQDTTG